MATESAALRKRNGAHYTPGQLARFVARRLLSRLPAGPVRVLDPACGDGELLLALAAELDAAGGSEPHLVGVDLDETAVKRAERRLLGARALSVTLRRGDFLSLCLDGSQADPHPAYDVVLSNPPYVRTQVLGATKARELAGQFGLRGRVDLYHAFVAAMTGALRPGGILALLCSNRFLVTKAGESLRGLLLDGYELEEVWDLGDTKLFQAAVLPAVVVARRRPALGDAICSFVKVYEALEYDGPAPAAPSLLGALEDGTTGVVHVDGRAFEIERGELEERTAKRPWKLASASASDWLKTVDAHTAGRLGDLGSIRVGIKTTADPVFIRSSWDDLPEVSQPEEELIRPLITHRVAERWRARNDDPSARRFVLYPHESQAGRRSVVDLAAYPRAATYLEQHRERLEKRTYVLNAGRRWYEIWVPQDPAAWQEPKIVWPDISDRPRFFVDRTGSVVNGDCYWVSCAGVAREELALVLAVANSSFALRYYDLCCGNRLYAGRRRFMTQYVAGLPMPRVTSADTQTIAAAVEELERCSSTDDPGQRARLEGMLDAAIWELFGIKEPAGQM